MVTRKDWKEINKESFEAIDKTGLRHISSLFFTSWYNEDTGWTKCRLEKRSKNAKTRYYILVEI